MPTLSEIYLINRSIYSIFTDGLKKKEKTAAGTVFSYPAHSYSPKNEKIHICTDSSVTLTVLSRYKIVFGYHEELQRAVNSNVLNLLRIEAQLSNIESEVADTLAEEGSTMVSRLIEERATEEHIRNFWCLNCTDFFFAVYVKFILLLI